jgi:2-dehydro-3-deoxyphosphogluconate aldolase / (4S)-4-hydroxy-2-oxoglutarate aldolase
VASRAEVLDIVLKSRVIAVLRLKDAAALPDIAAALGRGGVKALEVTMTTPGALDAIRAIAAAKAPGTIVGAGTVLDGDAAFAAVEAGADFVVSPVLNPAVVRACREAGVFVAPGAFTPTEILSAWHLGADVVKVFPATSLGPAFFKDVRGPLPAVRLMPTGGVTLENAAEFIRQGACCVGVGTALLDPAAIARKDWEALTGYARLLAEAVAAVS